MTMDLRELRFEVEEFCYDYGECLDEFDIERWPDFFTEDCLYKIVSRENFLKMSSIGLHSIPQTSSARLSRKWS